ncbi:MAG: fructokinase [Methanolobus sp. T82-4]|nr:MAG: fructokinase [Methanolobus sp. T82-4]
MLNSAVSLGRTGAEVFLLTEFADDDVGHLICQFLKDNSVSTELISIYNGRKSPLALACLNTENDARFSFYEDFPISRSLNTISDLSSEDIVMFSSILAVSREIRPGLKSLLDEAKIKGASIIYDPNIRPSHGMSSEDTEELVQENIAYADIVRASHEDMVNLKGVGNADDAYDYVRDSGCMCLIYTMGRDGVCLRTPELSKYYTIPEIETVSTVGAGDSFNSGIVCQFLCENISPSKAQRMSESVWDRVIERGMGFASYVCRINENYISGSFAANIKSLRKG